MLSYQATSSDAMALKYQVHNNDFLIYTFNSEHFDEH